jgi:hypothetical protein
MTTVDPEALIKAQSDAKRAINALAQAAQSGPGFAGGPRPTPRPVSERKRRRREVRASRRSNR